MYNDYWMLENGFLEREQRGDLRDLILRPFSQRDTVVVGPNDLPVTAYQRMKLYDGSQLPGWDCERVRGVVVDTRRAVVCAAGTAGWGWRGGETGRGSRSPTNPHRAAS